MRHYFLMIVALLLPALVWADDDWTTVYPAIERSIRQPQFPAKDYPITKFGAKETNTPEKNQKAINKAIEKCSKKGGGRVVVPAGNWKTGAITLLSGVNLHIEEGATLEFVFDPSLYPIVKTAWEGLDCWNLSPLIYAYGQKNIALTGKGTLDGGGSNETWWAWCGAEHFGWKPGMVSQRNGARARLLKMGEDGVPVDERRFGPEDGLRPQFVNFNQCEDILIEDVTLLRAPFWVLHPLESKNITVRGVHVNNDGPNGDGCDPESCDGVLIENCFFNTGDDCIAIKSGRNRDGRTKGMPAQNMIIRNCEMQNGHGGVVIGSEISGGANNIFAHDCVMDSPHLERVVRIKTNSARGGVVENIYARNIKVGQCDEAVLKINLDYDHNEVAERGHYPTVRNVYLDNVTCNKSRYGVMIVALDDRCQVYNINVDNCRFDGVAFGNSVKGEVRDLNYKNYFLNGSLQLTKAPYNNYSQWLTYSEIKRTPKSYLLDFSKKPKWSYVMGIELESMLDTYLKYGGKEILDYCTEYTDTMINEQGVIRGYRLEDYNLDNIRTGHFVARMYQLYPEEKNAIALRTMIKQMTNQPRTEDGVFWHKAIYSYQVWLDGIFMGLPYSVLTAKDFLKPKEALKVYNDAVDQIKKTYERTLDPKTGLNRHAWDETHEMFWADKETGLSQHCWGRAQGWYSMALIEILDALPEDFVRRDEVIEILRKDLDAVIKWQGPETGVWYQVMDEPGREGNYLESTCSSMFAYSLLKAYHKGYLKDQKYLDAGIKAYRGIIKNFIRVNADETISLTQCCAVAGLGPGTSPRVEAAVKKYLPSTNFKPNLRRDGSYEYYLSEPIRDNDAKGVGPFIWASLIMEDLGYHVDNLNEKINRSKVLTRNNPVNTSADPLSSLSVGNGRFVSTVDITGLQSYPEFYKGGVPLTTMSEWGWHSFNNAEKLTTAETQREMDLGHGRSETYAVEYKQGGRNQAATSYFRVNPHRLNLGTVGLVLKNRDGEIVPLESLTDVRQELQLYDGKIESTFKADGEKVDVTTAAMNNADALFARVKSNLLKDGRAGISFRFPYPTGRHADDAADWNRPADHSSKIISDNGHRAVIERTLDETTYYVTISWEGNGKLTEVNPHDFLLTTDGDVLTFSAEYSEKPLPADARAYEYDQAMKQNLKYWPRFWNNGAFVDFEGSTDPRAKELERRVVLSQYLTAINCAGNMPPQETGLTYNSWFGRPHLEMTWWHAVDFALWNRPEILARILDWYNTAAFEPAKGIARRQNFKGARWMKMTDPEAGEAPSNTGSFLIWQQPHYIYMAEELYRANPSEDVLKKYGDQVEATAEFMADFARACAPKDPKAPIKLYGATAMQESMSKDFSYNHPFEQAYWRYGLQKANQWRERRGLGRNAEWDDLSTRLAPLPVADGIYASGEPIKPFDANAARRSDFNPYSTPDMIGRTEISREDFATKASSDHPAALGACGLLPDMGHYDPAVMSATLDHVMGGWNWGSTWGWDYGMIAMAATRLGRPDVALDALLNEKGKNTYLTNGHNFQTADRLRVYLPGNGALLDAVALMCAGWDGTNVQNPGFPKDGTWKVRWEGLKRMQ